MLQLIELDDFIGKTVLRVNLSDKNAALFFEDDTFALFSIDRGYEYGDEQITFEADVEGIDLEDRLSLTILTKTEYNGLKRKREENRKKEEEKSDRARYEILRKKFENA